MKKNIHIANWDGMIKLKINKISIKKLKIKIKIIIIKVETLTTKKTSINKCFCIIEKDLFVHNLLVKYFESNLFYICMRRVESNLPV